MVRTILIALVAAGLSAAPKPDWPAAKLEALDTLVGLLNLAPPGTELNEFRAARFLEAKLNAAGIDAEIVESRPGRANLIARIRGNGSKRPLLLIGHLDAAASRDRSGWASNPPFADVRGGTISARGSRQIRGVAVGSLQVFLMIQRLKVPLDRDVIFVGVSDGELGESGEITYLLENHRSKIDAEFAISDGGRSRFGGPGLGDDYTRFEIQTAEKTTLAVELNTVAESADALNAAKKTPGEALEQAVKRLSEHEMLLELNETTREYFRRLAQITGLISHEAVLEPLEGVPDQNVLSKQRFFKSPAATLDVLLDPNRSLEDDEMLRDDLPPLYDSMVRTTLVSRIFKRRRLEIKGPLEATAQLDIRALPGEQANRLLLLLVRVINDPTIEVIPSRYTRPPHRPSSLRSDVFQAFESALERMYPDVPVLPTMSVRSTDFGELRAAGIATYGFGPARPEVSIASGIYGLDERLSVKHFSNYVEILWNVVLEVAASN
jgi:acetylornithine deacetylase/succinyl-diaminopimelate desuccinylase-like protein